MNGLTARMKRRIKRQLSGEKPTVWIGKSGVSQSLLNEIERRLERREVVKVKILRSALEGEEAESIAARTAEETGASLVKVRGHTFTLFKRGEE